MGKKKVVNFKIEHLDPLGQGVSKCSDKVTFIPKTLPREEGQAYIVDEKKGVQFALVDSINSESPMRIKGNCPHFQECFGCDYLHTPYTEEILYKEQALRKHLKQLILEYQEIKIHQVKETTRYRNRIQLHYDKKADKLGQINPFSHKIINIENCLLPMLPVQNKLKELYQGGWRELVDNAPPKGHIEIYLKNDGVQVSINQPYSFGGFTQVHPYMNKIMKEELSQIIFREKLNKSLIELFAGDGNLSNSFHFDEKYLIDFYTQPISSDDFYHFDLYKKKTLSDFKKKNSVASIQLLMLDPPRTGLKNLCEWVKSFKPNHILYISCNPATMARDLKELNYKIQEIHLFDMFPGSHHYETLTWLTRN